MHRKPYGLICPITHACNMLDPRWTIPILTEIWGYSKPEQFPNRQVVIQFRFSDPELDDNTYWVLARPGVPLEICTEIPGFDIDLFVETNRLSLSSIIVSRTTIAHEIEEGRLFLSGDAILSRTMDRWLYHRTIEDPAMVLQLDEVSLREPAVASAGHG